MLVLVTDSILISHCINNNADQQVGILFCFRKDVYFRKDHHDKMADLTVGADCGRFLADVKYRLYKEGAMTAVMDNFVDALLSEKTAPGSRIVRSTEYASSKINRQENRLFSMV